MECLYGEILGGEGAKNRELNFRTLILTWGGLVCLIYLLIGLSDVGGDESLNVSDINERNEGVELLIVGIGELTGKADADTVGHSADTL